jgi:hypothetical protein
VTARKQARQRSRIATTPIPPAVQMLTRQRPPAGSGRIDRRHRHQLPGVDSGNKLSHIPNQK